MAKIFQRKLTEIRSNCRRGIIKLGHEAQEWGRMRKHHTNLWPMPITFVLLTPEDPALTTRRRSTRTCALSATCVRTYALKEKKKTTTITRKINEYFGEKKGKGKKHSHVRSSDINMASTGRDSETRSQSLIANWSPRRWLIGDNWLKRDKAKRGVRGGLPDGDIKWKRNGNAGGCSIPISFDHCDAAARRHKMFIFASYRKASS